MARADQLLELVRAATKGDQDAIRQSVEAIAAEERAKQHHVLAERLTSELRSPMRQSPATSRIAASGQSAFMFEVKPRLRLSELVIQRDVETILWELIEEQQRASLLRAHGLEPRHRILLSGPPGNGKTSIAEGIAEALMVPLVVARYEGIIGSFLGETATKLEQLFEYARSVPCVLFLDEFDVLAKERGDVHETGEIKRVVSSLLLQVDRMPSYCVVVTATNHSELLDRAVWRRFQIRLSIDPPDHIGIAQWRQLFAKRWNFALELPTGDIDSKLLGLSFSELEQFGQDVLRARILEDASLETSELISRKLKHLSKMRSLGNCQGV